MNTAWGETVRPNLRIKPMEADVILSIYDVDQSKFSDVLHVSSMEKPQLPC